MSTIRVQNTCPNCSTVFKADIPVNPKDVMRPNVRCGLLPDSYAAIYRITTEHIGQFIAEKAQSLCPDVKTTLVARYCDNKRSVGGYAYLKIAFSEKVIQKGEDHGWYGYVGRTDENTKMIPSLFGQVVKKYQYDPKDVEGWLASYKTMENLEGKLGISEDDLKDIAKFCTPRVINGNDGSKWISVAAAPEKVIADMLTPIGENESKRGRIEIREVRQISEGVIEYQVFLYPEEITRVVDPRVKEILMYGKVKN